MKLRDVGEIGRWNGRKKTSFQGITLGFKSGGWALGGDEGRFEGGVGGRKLFDLAHFASLQKLFTPSLHAFSIALS